MEGRDHIKELFSEKLGNFEVPVRPELWNAISGKVAAASTTSAATTGISTLTKWLVSLGISAATITGVVVYMNSGSEDKAQQLAKEVTTDISDKESDKQENTASETSQTVNIKPVEEPRNVVSNNISPLHHTSTGQQTQQPVIGDLPLDRSVLERDHLVHENAITPQATTENPSTETPGAREIISREALQTVGIAETPVQEEKTEQKDYFIGNLVNVFTPNGDRINDYFEIELRGLQAFNLVVLDNRNQVIFSTTDINFKWDGNDQSGNAVPNGNYVYFFTATSESGTPVKEFSTVTIQR